MRVAFDVSPVTSTRTGVGNYCYYLLKHLLDTAPDTEYVGYSSGSAKVDLGPLSGRVERRHIAVPTRALYGAWSVLGRPRLDTLLGGADIAHGTNYFLPPTARARRVLTIHDLSFLARPDLCDPATVGPYARRVRTFARSADGVLAYSESTRRDIERLLGVGANRVTVAPMAVDEGFEPVSREEGEALVRPRLGFEEPYLLYVSTVEPRKNCATLVEILARIATGLPHRLVVIGQDGWRAEEVWDLARRRGVMDRIARPGYVPHAELPAFYCAADAFVFPTLYEGFGLPLLEAMKCGCPVVTSDNTSVPEVTGDAALRGDAMDVEAHAEAVLRVAGDQDLRDRLAAAGRVQAARFSWRDCALKTHGLYESLQGLT